MKSPGSYYGPAIEYTPETECFRGRPLVSAPLEFDVGGGKTHRVEFLVPAKGRGKNKGTEIVRVKIGRSTFSLAIVTPRGSKESYADAMFEDCDGLVIDCGSDVALAFLRIDMAARCGDGRALVAVACAEWGLVLRRIQEGAR